MLIFLSIYLMVFIFYIFSKIIKNKYFDRFNILFISAILSILPGFRSINVGTDTVIYNEILQADLFLNDYYINNLEPGFLYLVRFFQLFSLESIFFISIAFIANFLIINSIFKLENNRFLALLSYLTFSFVYMMGFNILRQYLALALYCYSLKYLFNDNWKKHIFLILLACLIHYSSIFYIVFMFLYYLFKNNKNYISYTVCFLIPFIMNFNSNTFIEIFINISDKGIVEKYIDNRGDTGSILQILFYLIILFLIIIFSNFKNLNYRFYLGIYIIFISFSINIALLGMAYEGFGRLIVNTYFSLIFIFSYLSLGKFKYIFNIIFLAIFSILFYYFYYITGYFKVFPYSFVGF